MQRDTPLRGIVRSRDDLSPIVLKRDEIVLNGDDRSQIVREADDRRRDTHVHTPSRITIDDGRKSNSIASAKIWVLLVLIGFGTTILGALARGFGWV